MKKQSIFILGLIILVASACTNDFLLDRKEDRLLGAWEFERVTFKENGDLFRNDITNEFRGDIIEFFGDYTAAYDDASLRVIFDGTWELYIDRFSDDEDDAEFFLDMTFFDFINQEEFSYFTNAITLTRNRMTLVSNTRVGTYRFKLRKF